MLRRPLRCAALHYVRLITNAYQTRIRSSKTCGMLHLRTLGTVNLSRDGELLGGAAQQRRLLAMLAVLGSAGKGGMSRDKLLALFWPEGDPDKARRAFNQSLYHIRKELGADDLFAGSAELRLNPSAITSDISEFERLLAAGLPQSAIEIYGGAFLDGFFLTANAEFEEWTSAARARYSACYINALKGLAESSRSAGDRVAEVRWRRLHVDADPIDAAPVVALMESLVALGKRPDAVQVARAHETRMAALFDLPADAAVIGLAASLRAGLRGPDQPTHVEFPKQDARVEVIAGNGPPRRSFGRRLAWAATTVTAVGLTLSLVAANHLRQDRALQNASVLVVTPFRVEGRSAPDKAYLSEGLLDMLTTRLAAAEAKRAADAGAVLRAWRAAELDGPRVPNTIEVSGLGKSLGAGSVVTGTAMANGNTFSITAELLDADRHAVISRVSVSGSSDSLGSLVDRVVSGLVLGEAGEGDRIRRPPNLPPAALHTYIQGAAAYRRGDFQEAIRFFSQAVANDPSFALAALDLAIAADRVSAAEQYDRGLALAWAGRAELSGRDSAYLVAFAGSSYPAPSPATEHLVAWQRAVTLDPNRPDAWFELGQSYYYNGAALGIADADERAEAAIRRALAVDSNFAPAARLLPIVLVNRGDTVALRALVRRSNATSNWGDLRVFLTWRTSLLLGDQRSLRSARQEFSTAPLASLRAIALASQIEGVGVADGDMALGLLRQRAATDREILDALLAMHSRALNAHDMDRVETVMATIRATEPEYHVDARLRVLDALYGNGNQAAATVSAGELATHLAAETGSTPADSAVRVADACALAQWRLMHADTAGVRASLKFLRNAGAPTFPVPVGANPMACADILDAALAPPDRIRAQLAQVDSLMLSGPAVGAGLRQANLILARLFEREGESQLALQTLQRWQYPRWWPRYRDTALREEARLLALAVGDSVTARRGAHSGCWRSRFPSGAPRTGRCGRGSRSGRPDLDTTRRHGTVCSA